MRSHRYIAVACAASMLSLRRRNKEKTQPCQSERNRHTIRLPRFHSSLTQASDQQSRELIGPYGSRRTVKTQRMHTGAQRAPEPILIKAPNTSTLASVNSPYCPQSTYSSSKGRLTERPGQPRRDRASSTSPGRRSDVSLTRRKVEATQLTTPTSKMRPRTQLVPSHRRTHRPYDARQRIVAVPRQALDHLADTPQGGGG